MLPVLAAPLLLAQLATSPPVAAPRADRLLAAAAASPRPAECSGREGRTRAGVSSRTLWDRARHPGISEYCNLLARGYARLNHSPQAALSAAQGARRIVHGAAAPLVLEARAELALGRPSQAWQLFERAQSIAKQSVEAPEALHDLAVAAEQSGHEREALAAYRALVPRAGLLDRAACRQNVYVEAAAVVMSQGPKGLNEAIGYLSEARQRRSPPGFEDFVLAELTLALDRQGRSDEASGVAAEVETTAGLRAALTRSAKAAPDDGASRCSQGPVLPSGELHAMIAVVAQDRDADLAREQWSAYLQAARGSAWTGYAQKKLAGLSSRRRSRRHRR